MSSRDTQLARRLYRFHLLLVCGLIACHAEDKNPATETKDSSDTTDPSDDEGTETTLDDGDSGNTQTDVSSSTLQSDDSQSSTSSTSTNTTSTPSDSSTPADSESTGESNTMTTDDSSTGDTTTDNTGKGYGREVLSWVAPYGVSRGLKNLDADFGDFSPKNVLTSLALQFWRPTDDGELVYEQGIDDETVREFVAKGDENGIRILLCVYNNNQQDPGWDWPAARAAFMDHPEEFAESLFKTAVDLGLGGVDVDFEGYSNYDDEREAFKHFLQLLADKLHPKGMILTVDTFHSPCFNAPNMAWWKDWVGIVDHVHPMGYGTLYEANEETFGSCPSDKNAADKPVFKFSFQSSYALENGLPPDFVSVGLPDRDAWGGQALDAHLNDILSLESPTGIAFWDFALSSNAWQESSNWELARKIRDTK